MGTIDSRTIRAGELRPGHYLIGVDARGEHMHRIVAVREGEPGPDTWPPLLRHGFVVVHMEGGRRARLGRRDVVRVADPSAVADSQRVNG